MKEGKSMTGVMTPVITPFAADLHPEADRLISHCRWLLSQGCDGLAVFGTTSEGNSLSVEERMTLLDALVDAGIDPALLLPGTGCCALSDSVRLTTHAVGLGCAGVLMLPPFYYKQVDEEGLFRSYAEVIERVGDERLRIYLYHFPQISQVPISLKLIEHLLKAYPGVVIGIKDSSSDWNNTKAMLDVFPEFAVFTGNELFLLENMRNGGVGCITATGNINPAPIKKLYAEWRSPEADGMQAEINELRLTLQRFPMIPALKQVMAHYADDPIWANPRPPLTPLTPGQAADLLDTLRERGFSMPGLGNETA